jgi:hypothetical protein
MRLRKDEMKGDGSVKVRAVLIKSQSDQRLGEPTG